MRHVRFPVLLVSVWLLSACSGTYHAYKSMIKLAMDANVDVVLSYSDIDSANYDYLYVQRGDNRRIAMGLMYIENSQLKWLSADNSMLVTRNGRIIRSIGLQNDLLHLTNMESDPLRSPLAITDSSSWLRLADWGSGEYGYQIRSVFKLELNHSLNFFGNTVPVIKLTETLHYDNNANFLRFDDEWQNVYWLDAKTGRVLKSSQQLSPGAERFELVFISEVVRQLKVAGIAVAAEAK